MIRTLFAAAAICAVAGPAMADSARGCYWGRGGYICDSASKSEKTTTYSHCVSGLNGSLNCRTTTEQNKPPLTHGAVGRDCMFTYGASCD